ncbi:hypothetical protein QWY87_16740 [Lutimonas halocynthiae]|uniref:DUF6913 domain-containing protein n=1 Tax=Lutimonas halocynthiae TaxID=1446477 RepID=UPI0025B2FA40|nr:hypothetical protein [Lutimonas halocynthiae]MDN3644364.1 hypothetical protein [Lutimonas halocynthiae]
MGLLNLKNKTAHKFIKKQRKAIALNKEFDVISINRVGVLSELSLIQTYDFTKRLSESLGLRQEDMKVFLFDVVGKSEAPGFYGMCDEKNFGFNAKIKSEALSKFVDIKFDLLINYCNPELLFPRVIMLKSKAQLKAGFEAEANFFNDISVKTPGNDIDTFNAELVKYLQILKLID